MSWRLAKALEKLRDQVNAARPGRRKDSDGSVGDTAHSARASDHNPDGAGVVHAIDITHDPRGGFDSYAFADLLLKKQDPRLKYVISNRRIGSGPSGPSPGKWRKYTGSNPHDHHVHVSCVTGALQDDTRAWDIDADPDAIPEPPGPEYRPPRPTLRRGSTGEYVKLLQAAIGAEPDGDFGPLTEAKLKAWQESKHLIADGICGPQTWKTIP